MRRTHLLDGFRHHLGYRGRTEAVERDLLVLYPVIDIRDFNFLSLERKSKKAKNHL